MAKHKKQTEASNPWYKNTKIVLGIGIGGIVVMIGLLFAVSQANNTPSTTSGAVITKQTGDVQEISMTVTAGSYQPSTLTVEAGKPVKWIVDGTRATGCTTYLLSPQLGVNKKLTSGANVIEFMAPTEKGTYGFSCSMGMVKGTMNVI